MISWIIACTKCEVIEEEAKIADNFVLCKKNLRVSKNALQRDTHSVPHSDT